MKQEDLWDGIKGTSQKQLKIWKATKKIADAANEIRNIKNMLHGRTENKQRDLFENGLKVVPK